MAGGFDDVPANRHFGFTLVSRGEGKAVVSLRVRPEYLQEEGVLHGGILSTLADTAAVYTLHPDLEPGWMMTSIEFKMNFLRPAVEGNGEVLARAELVRRGRRVGLCDVEVFQADKLVAKGSFTYLFFRRGS